MKKGFFVYISMLCVCLLHAQKPSALSVLVSNNVSSFPVTAYPKVFYTGFHPGLDVLYHQKWNSSDKHQLWYHGNIGAFYHRFFQTALKLNGGLSYAYRFTARLNGEAGFNGGYLHSFYHYQIFKLNNEGEYVKISGIRGRTQFNAGLYIGCSYALLKNDPEKLRLAVQLKTFVHGPFAGNYVPVVPYNNFSVGIIYRWKNEK